MKEKKSLETYFMAKQQKVAKGMFLQDLGIKLVNTPDAVPTGPQVRLLQPNEKMACHEFMKKLGQYEVQHRVPVLQSFEPEKMRKHSTSISKESFQKVVRQKFGNVGQTLTNDLLVLLVAYLQDEEVGAVNLTRVRHAIDSREPLQQAGLEHLAASG